MIDLVGFMDRLMSFSEHYGDNVATIGIMAFFLKHFMGLADKQWKYYNNEIKECQKNYNTEIKAREAKYMEELEKRDKRIINFTTKLITVMVSLTDALISTEAGKHISSKVLTELQIPNED